MSPFKCSLPELQDGSALEEWRCFWVCACVVSSHALGKNGSCVRLVAVMLNEQCLSTKAIPKSRARFIAYNMRDV